MLAEVVPARMLLARAALADHPGHRGREVVVAYLACGYAAQGAERVDVAVEEGLLPA